MKAGLYHLFTSFRVHITATHRRQSHRVHTLPEPWFMVHLVDGFRPSGREAEYNARFAYLALKDFPERIPGGQGGQTGSVDVDA